MAENKNLEEEYQYVEEGEPSFEPSGAEPVAEDKASEFENKAHSLLHQPNVKRNSMIVIAGLMLLIALIKCSSNKNDLTNKKTQMAPAIVQPTPEIAKSVAPAAPAGVPPEEIINIISSQKSMQNSIVGVSDQLAQLNIHLTSQDKSYDTLQKALEDVQAKQNANAALLQEILIQIKTKPIMPRPEVQKAIYEAPKMEYFVQAIIPGRAWIVNEKGMAMTVRVGSEIPGYGIVKEIDPPEGRVVMSSSKVFRFKHDD
jgi:intracellular multiplication protein IcmG